MIGYLGDVVFSASSDRVFSFRNLKVSASADWGEHKRIGQKSQWEFLGPNAGKVSFEIVLDANYGVEPRKEIEKLISYSESGAVNALVIGGKRIGSRWRITSVSSAWNCITSSGILTKASVSLTIEEYQ